MDSNGQIKAHRSGTANRRDKRVEWNWQLGSIPGSAANIASALNSMFGFDHARHAPRLVLDPSTGAVVRANTLR